MGARRGPAQVGRIGEGREAVGSWGGRAAAVQAQSVIPGAALPPSGRRFGRPAPRCLVGGRGWDGAGRPGLCQGRVWRATDPLAVPPRIVWGWAREPWVPDLAVPPLSPQRRRKGDPRPPVQGERCPQLRTWYSADLSLLGPQAPGRRAELPGPAKDYGRGN